MFLFLIRYVIVGCVTPKKEAHSWYDSNVCIIAPLSESITSTPIFERWTGTIDLLSEITNFRPSFIEKLDGPLINFFLRY